MHTFACPYCRGDLTFDASMAGLAVSCPHCGNAFVMPGAIAPPSFAPPIAVEQRPFAPGPSYGKAHVITERTSKRYKVMRLLGWLLMLGAIGALMAMPDASDGMHDDPGRIFVAAAVPVMFVVGSGLEIFGRLLAWWHHG